MSAQIVGGVENRGARTPPLAVVDTLGVVPDRVHPNQRVDDKDRQPRDQGQRAGELDQEAQEDRNADDNRQGRQTRVVRGIEQNIERPGESTLAGVLGIGRKVELGPRLQFLHAFLRLCFTTAGGGESPGHASNSRMPEVLCPRLAALAATAPRHFEFLPQC